MYEGLFILTIEVRLWIYFIIISAYDCNLRQALCLVAALLILYSDFSQFSFFFFYYNLSVK